MKRKLLFLFITSILCTLFIFTACETTKTENKTEDSSKTVQAPKTETKKEPEKKDPPNVAFAKKLQKCLENRDIKGAIALFDKMPSQLQNDMELKLLLGSLYLSDRNFDSAIETANIIISAQPENMEAYELLSLAYKAKGDKASQKLITDKIKKTDPYNVTINIQEAEEYAVGKKYKLARQSYQKALKKEPSNTNALFGYGQMSYYLHDTKAAEKAFQSILDQDGNDAQALAYMGKLAAQDENYLRASKFIKEAIKNDPYNYDYYLDSGTYSRYQGKYNDAIAAWNKAVELDPTYFLAYAYLAGTYDEQNKFDLAIENYQNVIKTNPQYYYAYEETAILEYHMGNWEAARKYFTEASKYSDNVSYPLMIAVTYLKQNDSFHAKEVLKPLLKKLNKDSLDYSMVRFFHDPYTVNAENSLESRISKEENRTQRGKMLFYMGLYYELNKFPEKANEYYVKVTNMQAPMFFEYRFAEWSLKK